MKTSRTNFAVGVTFGLAVLAVWAWQDTAHYRVARQALGQIEASPETQAQAQAVATDKRQWGRCNAQNFPSSLISSQVQNGYAACMLSALPRVKTYLGAAIFAYAAAEWLRSHPKDDAVKNAALATIAVGRNNILMTKPLDNAEEVVIQAQVRSVILDLFPLYPRSGSQAFGRAVQLLDDAEFAVLEPETAERQHQWMLHNT